MCGAGYKEGSEQKRLEAARLKDPEAPADEGIYIDSHQAVTLWETKMVKGSSDRTSGLLRGRGGGGN